MSFDARLIGYLCFDLFLASSTIGVTGVTMFHESGDHSLVCIFLRTIER